MKTIHNFLDPICEKIQNYHFRYASAVEPQKLNISKLQYPMNLNKTKRVGPVDNISNLMRNKGDCRTAPATPGLLITLTLKTIY